MPPLAGRLSSPAGLITAAFCLLLPFLTASCSDRRVDTRWQVKYTGVDVIAGGRPDVAFTDNVHQTPMHTLDDAGVRQLLGDLPARLPSQPLAWVAAALLLAALAATALRSRPWRATFTAGLALAAAVVLWGATVHARRDATVYVATVISGAFTPPPSSPPTAAEVRQWQDYDRISHLFHYAYGLWLTIGLLTAVGLANAVHVVRHPSPGGDPPPAAEG